MLKISKKYFGKQKFWPLKFWSIIWRLKRLINQQILSTLSRILYTMVKMLKAEVQIAEQKRPNDQAENCKFGQNFLKTPKKFKFTKKIDFSWKKWKFSLLCCSPFLVKGLHGEIGQMPKNLFFNQFFQLFEIRPFEEDTNLLKNLG
jgi:hypothetical protein